MQIIIRRNYEEVSLAAALIVEAAVRSKPQTVLALPTGKTPKGLYRELIRMHREKRLDFSRVSIFLLDEFVGLRADHPQAFRVYLWREFLNYVNVRRANVYVPDENYEQTIRRVRGIDLLVCGIGCNGHVAFNEPGSAEDSRTRVVDLSEETRNALKPGFVSEEVPRQAMTMGLATIFEAREILLLASGPSKAKALHPVIEESAVVADIPAAIVIHHRDTTVIADHEAFPEDN